MAAKPAARLVRWFLLAGGTFVLLVVVTWPAGRAGAPASVLRALPFAVIAAATVLHTRLRTAVDAIVQRLTRHREVTPYSALAEAAQHLRSPSLREALPGLAQALADGTAAHRAAVWMAAGERLVVTASHPASGTAGEPESADSLAALLARPGIGHVVPVLDGGELRAVLTIEKPESPITPQDRVLMRDVAHGAALLLRRVALNAELTERVRRAEHLARELRASRQRLAQAREVERRRLLTELSRATSGRLAALREHVAAARGALGSQGAGTALTRARTEVDELLDRFRVIARGVYPAVLRSQGPAAALEELVADLRRPVRLTGDLDVRMAWQIESAAYQVTAATLAILAAEPADGEIRVRLTRGGSWVRILVEDPSPPVTAKQVRTVLVDDVERLAALGGDVECADGHGTGLRLQACLPDRLDAATESMT
jgi:hypothetical protein